MRVTAADRFAMPGRTWYRGKEAVHLDWDQTKAAYSWGDGQDLVYTYPLTIRNHYIGDGNQQMTADVAAIYAGILSCNWPLASFGYSSEHGFQAVLEECFDDDGVQLRKNYQTYTMRPIFWAGEVFRGAGLNVYENHKRRLTQIVGADTLAKGQGAPFQDVEFWQFVKGKRLR
jgi:hypothetical protein